MSIRAKLMLLTSLSSGLALLIAGFLVGFNSYRSDQRELAARTLTQAKITASITAGAVTFDDVSGALKSLEALRSDAEVISAKIQRTDGSVLAQIDFHRTTGSHPLLVRTPISLGEPIGSVTLQASSASIEAKLQRNAAILLAVLAGAMFVALISAAFLQRIVSKPYSDLARTKGELERALLAAQAGARAKSEFLANMSHEIRTPMNGVIGMLDLVEVAQLPPEPRSMIETARSAADALMTIINDVLDFSKIDAGKLVLESIPVDLRALTEEVSTLFTQQARAKGVEVTCAIHNDVPARVGADPTRLRQILANLVGNAVKFTERGEVFIGVQCARARGSRERAVIHFIVSDTGIGMSDEARTRLFQAFTQADGSTTRRFGGTGLGLAITRRLVDAMRGKIRVKSASGAGTTFSVSLPMRILEQQVPRDTPILKGMRALIVDDNPTNRCVLEHYLEQDGIAFQSVSSGAEGLQALREASSSGKRFDAVVLDYQMPGMDGVGFLTALREDALIADTRCMMLSSLGDRTEAAAALDVPIWLSKPVRRAELRSALETLRSPIATITASHTRRDDSALVFPGASVLVVEDNEVNQKVSVRMLRAFGIEAQLACDGAQAVAAVRERPFDLVFMDCQMPVMDGYEATATIRGFSSLPIVAMTANALAGDKERCLACGMDDFMTKPVRKEILGAMLARWLRPDTALPVNTVSSCTPVEANVEVPAATLDEGALQSLRDLMAHDFGVVIADYLRDVPQQLGQMESALEQGDRTSIERHAHSVKSSSLSVGALSAARIAESLEVRARRNASQVEVQRMIAALRAAFQLLAPRLERAARADLTARASTSSLAEGEARFVKSRPQ
jgi:two-component system sensor histidine kinase/response regulator